MDCLTPGCRGERTYSITALAATTRSKLAAALVDADHAVHRLCKPVGAARGWLPVQR
jgi:hypothetical protein